MGWWDWSWQSNWEGWGNSWDGWGWEAPSTEKRLFNDDDTTSRTAPGMERRGSKASVDSGETDGEDVRAALGRAVTSTKELEMIEEEALEKSLEHLLEEQEAANASVERFDTASTLLLDTQTLDAAAATFATQLSKEAATPPRVPSEPPTPRGRRSPQADPLKDEINELMLARGKSFESFSSNDARQTARQEAKSTHQQTQHPQQPVSMQHMEQPQGPTSVTPDASQTKSNQEMGPVEQQKEHPQGQTSVTPDASQTKSDQEMGPVEQPLEHPQGQTSVTPHASQTKSDQEMGPVKQQMEHPQGQTSVTPDASQTKSDQEMGPVEQAMEHPQGQTSVTRDASQTKSDQEMGPVKQQMEHPQGQTKSDQEMGPVEQAMEHPQGQTSVTPASQTKSDQEMGPVEQQQKPVQAPSSSIETTLPEDFPVKQEQQEDTGPKPDQDSKWRCDKFGVPLKPAALYSRFYRSIRSRNLIC